MSALFYALRVTLDGDGLPIGFHVAIHENEEMPATWVGPTFPTVEAADAHFHLSSGRRIDWQEPDADACRDALLIARDPSEHFDGGETA